jgi:hypothetical protein
MYLITGWGGMAHFLDSLRGKKHSFVITDVLILAVVSRAESNHGLVGTVEQQLLRRSFYPRLE